MPSKYKADMRYNSLLENDNHLHLNLASRKCNFPFSMCKKEFIGVNKEGHVCSFKVFLFTQIV